MSGERNRRTLAFRGGGLAGLTGSSAVGGGNCNSCEALACQDRQFNGNRPDQEEDRDLGANGTSQKRVEGAGSVSDSTEPEAEEEEDPEGGSGPVGEGEYRVDSVKAEDACWEGNGLTTGNKPSSGDVRESGSGATETETGSRKCGVEMRPQMLLLKHSQFHASWLQEYPWLKFCQETGLMSCSWCHTFATKSSDELVKGSRNYKRALLLRHHLSSEHGRNDPTKQVRLTQLRRSSAFLSSTRKLSLQSEWYCVGNLSRSSDSVGVFLNAKKARIGRQLSPTSPFPRRLASIGLLMTSLAR